MIKDKHFVGFCHITWDLPKDKHSVNNMRMILKITCARGLSHATVHPPIWTEFIKVSLSFQKMMFTFLLLCKIWLTSLSVQPAFATISCSRGVINLSSVNEYWSSVKKSMSRDVTIPTKTPPRYPLSEEQSIDHRLREDRQIHNRLQIRKLPFSGQINFMFQKLSPRFRFVSFSLSCRWSIPKYQII